MWPRGRWAALSPGELGRRNGILSGKEGVGGAYGNTLGLSHAGHPGRDRSLGQRWGLGSNIGYSSL